jgi:hypothetical protein
MAWEMPATTAEWTMEDVAPAAAAWTRPGATPEELADMWYAAAVVRQAYGGGHPISLAAWDAYRASGGTGN